MDDESVGRVSVAGLRMNELKIGLALADGGGRGKEAQSLAYDRRGIGEGVEELGVLGEERLGLGRVRAEDGVVLGAETGEGGRVGAEQVVGKAKCYGRRIVACEEEDDELRDGHVDEGFVDLDGTCTVGGEICLLLGEVRVGGERDDGFGLGLSPAGFGRDVLVNDGQEVVADDAVVVPHQQWASGVDEF